MPPLIGYASATGGTLDYGAGILAAILFAWQFPHFNSLSWNLRPDYSKAGYRMMAVTNPELCKRVALRYSVGCIGICSFAAPLLEGKNYKIHNAFSRLISSTFIILRPLPPPYKYSAIQFYNILGF